jgi:pimeloyl-ACP methyl ester carboxylesterase
MALPRAAVALPGATIDIEYAWLNRGDERRPLVVFLHEGLGSIAMWRDWPGELCRAGGHEGLVYSRYGYGDSTPRPPDERWPPGFMHDEAQVRLPRLLEALHARGRRRWLVGHSDGGSIALIHAVLYPDEVAGVVAIAPHIMVEDVSIRSIERARDAYRTGDLRGRLARYHADPDSAFRGWNDVWLSPDFRGWSIEAMLGGLRCPVLAIQGVDDEYGTLAQVEGIRQRAPRTEVVAIDACGHSPHRDRPEAVTRSILDFMARHTEAADNPRGGGAT